MTDQQLVGVWMSAQEHEVVSKIVRPHVDWMHVSAPGLILFLLSYLHPSAAFALRLCACLTARVYQPASSPGLVAADGRPIINEDKHLREALADEGEFDPRPAPEMPDAEYENYLAKIRAEVGYDDDAFESDAESGGKNVQGSNLGIHPVPSDLW